MSVGNTLFWLRFGANLVLEILGDDDPEAGGQEALPPVLGLKPERIQFWVGQLARLVFDIVDGASEETGKSGEPSQSEG